MFSVRTGRSQQVVAEERVDVGREAAAGRVRRAAARVLPVAGHAGMRVQHPQRVAAAGVALHAHRAADAGRPRGRDAARPSATIRSLGRPVSAATRSGGNSRMRSWNASQPTRVLARCTRGPPRPCRGPPTAARARARRRSRAAAPDARRRARRCACAAGRSTPRARRSSAPRAMNFNTWWPLVSGFVPHSRISFDSRERLRVHPGRRAGRVASADPPRRRARRHLVPRGAEHVPQRCPARPSSPCT